jgi:Flp pilus assembly protein TadD
VVPAARRTIGPALSYPLLSLVLLFVAFAAAPVPPSASALGLNALALLAGLVVSTAAHEGAHALAGRAVGLCVIHVYLGRGPSVWERTVGSARLVLQAIPFTGATMVVARSTRWLRLRLMAFYAAGPLSNLLLLVASIRLLSDDDSFESFALRPMPLLAFALVNGMLVLFNVLPSPPRTKRGVTTLGTDGWNFLALPFRSDDKLVPLVTAYTVWEAARLTARGKVAEASTLVGDALKRDPGSLVARVAHTDLLVAMRRWPEAAVRLRLLLDDPAARRAFPDAMALLANNLAWADFMEGDPTLLDEADRRSKEALAAAPERSVVHGTRGAVLLARGELGQAEERLTFAFARNEPPNKALNACCLAMLHARRGERAEAETWLAKARSLSPQCSLLARAEASLAAEVTATASSSPPEAPHTT